MFLAIFNNPHSLFHGGGNHSVHKLFAIKGIALFADLGDLFDQSVRIGNRIRRLAVQQRRPGIAASWGPKVQSAEKDGSTLRIGCASDFAASHLATHHQRDFIEAFAPDAARVVFQAGGPFDAN